MTPQSQYGSNAKLLIHSISARHEKYYRNDNKFYNYDKFYNIEFYVSDISKIEYICKDMEMYNVSVADVNYNLG